MAAKTVAPVPGAGCWVPGARCEVWRRIPLPRCPVPGAGCPVLGARCWGVPAGRPVLGAGCWLPGARCPVLSAPQSEVLCAMVFASVLRSLRLLQSTKLAFGGRKCENTFKKDLRIVANATAALSTGHRAPGNQQPAPSTGHRAPGNQQPAPSTGHPARTPQHRAPSTGHPAPSTGHRGNGIRRRTSPNPLSISARTPTEQALIGE